MRNLSTFVLCSVYYGSIIRRESMHNITKVDKLLVNDFGGIEGFIIIASVV